MVKKSQIKKMSWDEYFEKELNVLGSKVEKYVKENNNEEPRSKLPRYQEEEIPFDNSNQCKHRGILSIKIDAVVPLLRGGNISGTYLAYRLNILKILPVQYKYFFENNLAELRQIQKINEGIFKREEKTVFLLVEGNHCFGTSASYAAKGLKKQFPNSEIIYAASNMDYHYQNVIKDAKISFYGRLQNDCEECSEEECKKLGLKYKEYKIFPWENINEELTTMKMKQYSFSDIEKTKNNSEFCESFDLSDVYK